jgi:hypothetical protein
MNVVPLKPSFAENSESSPRMHHRTLELGDDLAEDVNALRFELPEMVEAKIQRRFRIRCSQRHDEVIVSINNVSAVKTIVTTYAEK